MARGDGEAQDEAGIARNPFYAPWFTAPAARWLGTPPPRLAQGAGAQLPTTPARRLGRLPLPHREGLHHDHCFLGAPDVSPGHEAEGLAALARRGAPLRLRAVPTDHPAHAGLRALPGARVVARRERAFLRAGLGFDAHMEAALRGKKRKELRRQRARLEEAGALTEDVLTGTEDIASWGEAFLALEAAGWKGEAGTAMARRENEAAFLRAVLQGAAEAGALRRFVLRLDARPIAMVIGLTSADRGLYTYKIAHDPAYDRYSPGVMAMLLVTRHVLGKNGFAYADSCAAEGHPMIDSLWRERRVLLDWIVPGGPVSRCVVEAITAAGLAERPAERLGEGTAR